MITVQERILEKAEELFKKYGIKSITMDEIAARLGISKKTIYQSFADKNELVLQIFNHHICKSREDCFVASEQGQNAIHEVLLSLESFNATMQNMNPNVMYDLEKYHPEVFAKFTEFKNKFLHDSILKNIQRGIKEEVYRSDINPEIITRLRLATLLLGTNIELFPAHQFRIADTELEIVTHFLSGIVTPKGARILKRYITKMAEKQTTLN